MAELIGHGRLLRLGLALLIVSSTLVPIAQEISSQQRYNLSTSTIRLVGETNKNLAKKITFDAQNSQWQFNKDGIKATESQKGADPLQALRSQIGGAGKKDDSLYSVDLPTDGKKGVRYYDNNTDLSFNVAPEFSVTDGQVRNGKLVYPISDGAKIVYTAMNNGMKEDIVLSHNIGNALQFRYQLDLPETLQAKILSDGSVGIYSADPTLFGDISFGTDMDRAKIESARLTAVKDHLLFAIPAPIIKQSGAEQMRATAQFRLEGTELILYANNMNSVTYPASVDPSVVVTSTSDFTSGNNEGNIDFNNGQINRGGLSGGTTGSWTSLSNFSAAARADFVSVAYNGNMYMLGGQDGTSTAYYSDVTFAPINSDGTLGTWTATTSFTGDRSDHTSFAYNGYMYVIGGTGLSANYSDAQYAPINSDGTLGTWTSTSGLPLTIYNHASAVYNGNVYILGGVDNTSTFTSSTVRYAPLNANGTIGTWGTTTNFTTARNSASALAYNGYLYIAGGYTGSASLNDVQYARINADGTIGTWSATAGLVNARNHFGFVAAKGYVYAIAGKVGGTASSIVEYAQINSNGSIGSWATTAIISPARFSAGTTTYNGYLYMMGGADNLSNPMSDVRYAKIDPAGVLRPYVTDASSPATARAWSAGVAYNGYLYMVGGCTAVSADTCSTASTVVSYAPINADGSIGTWANTTNALPAARGMGAVVADQGRLYFIGGRPTSTTVSATVYYVGLNTSTGNTTGAWTSVASPTGLTARYGHAAVMYNSSLYILGGCTTASGACAAFQNDVEYAKLSSSGGFATNPSCANNFCPLTSFTTARRGLSSAIVGNTIYISGGTHATSDTACNTTASTNCSDIQYAAINADGTLGAWTSTTNMPTARYDHSFYFEKGYLYAGSGKTAAATFLNSVTYARLTASGAIAADSGCGSAWCTTQSVTTSRGGEAYASYRGSLYVIGGQTATSTVAATAYSAEINNGGMGKVVSTNAGTALASTRESLATVAYKGYLYVLGGSSSAAVSADVLYAPINTNGALGSWLSTTSFTIARRDLDAVAYNGYMYVLGGNDGSDLNDVQYAPIHDDGTVGSWVSTSSFTTARSRFTAVISNGYMYILGGLNNFSILTDTQYVAINSDGTLGTWTGTTSIASGREAPAITSANGYVYVTGGWTGSAYANDVQYAPLNSDGTIGTWSTTTSFTKARYRHKVVAYNGNLYLAGGNNANVQQADVQYAPINANGTLGKWQSTTGLTTARESFGFNVYNGYLYTTAGWNGGEQSSVEYALLDSQSRVGNYSKLIDLGSTFSLSGFSYNGVVPGGGATIVFRTAGSDGLFNSAASINTLSGSGTGAVCGTGGGGGGTRYVWLGVTLDDTQGGAAFADSSGTSNAMLSDISVNYAGGGQHPSPQQRLRGGKFFQTEALQPLDTCGP
ncbi:MAG: hypothetical protein ABIR37_03165 [Candidatus Saccharimonadales bacterium]